MQGLVLQWLVRKWEHGESHNDVSTEERALGATGVLEHMSLATIPYQLLVSIFRNWLGKLRISILDS